jgi:hypothetical protein
MWPSLRWLSLRQPSLRHGAVVIAFLGCVGLAAAALASVASSQRGNFFQVRAHSASEDVRGRADDTRPEPGSSARAAAAQLDDETTGSVGPFRGLSNFARAVLPLSDEDRFHIYEGVMRMPDAPVADGPTAEIAESLPGEVALQDLPLSVIRRIPLVQGYKFAKFDDRILVVNPASRLVVAMIPRYKLLQ